MATPLKIALAGICIVIGLAIVFRYDVSPTTGEGFYQKHDRWSATTRICHVERGCER